MIPFLLPLFGSIPALVLSTFFHSIAARNGRAYGWFNTGLKGKEPFVDERLNGAYGTLRRFSMISCLGLIAVGAVGGLILSSEMFYFGALVAALLTGQAHGLFKEGAFAYGAEIRETPSKVVPEFRPAGSS